MEEYKLIRSARKTIAAQVLRDGTLLVRAPQFCPESIIEDFLLKKKAILDRYQEEIRNLPPIPSITRAELKKLKVCAQDKILPRVEELSESTGLTYKGARITSARQRFGSCSIANSLCFSAFLVLAEQEEIDYVIVHELCHTVEHNHSNRFYALVERFLPDWKACEKKLKKIVIPEISE